MNKKLIKCVIAMSLIASQSFSETNLSVKTGGNVDLNFTPRKEDVSKEIEAKKIRFENLSYNLNLLKLNVDLKDYGLGINFDLKSSRKNHNKNDWDNSDIKILDRENNAVLRKENNHDFQGKLSVDYKSPKFYGLEFNQNLTYYLDNLTDLKDYYTLSEYVDEEGNKNRTGNVILKSSLKGTFDEAKTDVDLSLEYKSNRLVNFTKDESYLKTNLKLAQPIYDYKLTLNHSLDYDLKFANTKFDTFNNDLSSYPDFIHGRYIDRYKQKAGIKLNKEDNTGVIAGISSEFDTFVIGGYNKESKMVAIWNKISPKLEFGVAKKIDDVILTPMVYLESEIQDTKYYPQTDKQILSRETRANLIPKVELGVVYDKKFSEDRTLKQSTKVSYSPKLLVYPYITDASSIEHTYKLEEKLDFKYKVNDNLTTKLKLDSDVSLPIHKKELKQVKAKIDLDLDLEYKLSEKLDLSAKLTNKLNLTSKEKVLNPDNFTENANLELKLNYNILDNLKYSVKAVADSKSSFNYFMTEDKSLDPSKNTVSANDKKSLIYNGKAVPITILNTFELNNSLDYSKKLNEKTKLNTGLDVNTKLEMFALKPIKYSNYKNTSEFADDGKQVPLLSTDREIKYNIGGKVDVAPKVDVEYSILDNLVLKSGVKANLIFEREVVNKIEDSTRPDDGLYGFIDKKFTFKKLVPSINLELEYKW